jgi:hypothetical protein
VTALSDALAAAQARAVQSLGKQYIGDAVSVDSVSASLDAIGLTDTVDKARWLAALDIIKATGGEAPAEQESRQPDIATDKQWSFIRKLADEKGTVAPVGPLTKEQAHGVIEQLQAGTYKPDEYLPI